MTTLRVCVRKTAAERAEAGERRRRISLVVATDRIGDERVDVRRRDLPGFPERADAGGPPARVSGDGPPRGHGGAGPLEDDPVEQPPAQVRVGGEPVQLLGGRLALDL